MEARDQDTDRSDNSVIINIKKKLILRPQEIGKKLIAESHNKIFLLEAQEFLTVI